jgi:hypothetical protein
VSLQAARSWGSTILRLANSLLGWSAIFVNSVLWLQSQNRVPIVPTSPKKTSNSGSERGGEALVGRILSLRFQLTDLISTNNLSIPPESRLKAGAGALKEMFTVTGIGVDSQRRNVVFFTQILLGK